MLHNNTKKNFPTVVFVIASLSAFVALALIYLFFTLGSGIEALDDSYVVESSEEGDRYYFKKGDNTIDPLVSHIPSFEDVLSGPIISKLDPMMGDRAASVVLVEYADFECSFCQKQEQALKRIVAKYPYKVRLIWKDYPSTNEESGSFKAAVAARCAQKQEQFWPYHDFLYEMSSEFNYEGFMKIAGILQMDVTAFDKCLKEPGPRELVLDNITEANALDIGGVPFLYINGQEIMGEASFEDIDRIVQIELDEK